MWHFRSRWKLLKNFPHLQVWEDYCVPPTSNHPQYFSQSTLLSRYALPFFAEGKKKEATKRWSGLPRFNSLLLPPLPGFPKAVPQDCVFCLLEQVGEPVRATPSCAGDGSFGSYICLFEVSRLRSGTSPQLPLPPLFQMAMGITSRGWTSSSVFCPLTQTEFEMTGVMLKGWSAGTMTCSMPPWGPVSSLTLHWVILVKTLCACLQSAYYISVHNDIARGLDFRAPGWDAAWLILVEEQFPSGSRGFAVVLHFNLHVRPSTLNLLRLLAKRLVT